MKVGTLTFHYNQNYGALLQAYALQKVLRNMGHSAELIDYRYRGSDQAMTVFPRLLTSPNFNTFAGNLLRYFPRTFIQSTRRIKRTRHFLSTHIPHSSTVFHSYDELCEKGQEYDAYITGSDQVWNPGGHAYSEAFRLEFVPDGKKRISYAASIAVPGFTDSQASVFKNAVDRFDSISVREHDAVKLVQYLCPSKDVHHVLDPTLLLREEDWKDLIKADSHDGKYILCYFLGPYKKALPLLKRLSAKLGLPVIKVGWGYSDIIDGRGFIKRIDAGPIEFMELLAGASWFVTNSFHGVALSIVLRKKFSAIVNTTSGRAVMGSRLFSLLATVELEKAIYDEEGTIPEDDLFNYDRVDHALARLREDSFEFLNLALQS